MTHFYLLLLLAIQDPLSAPALQKRISFRCPAAPVTKVVAALAEQTDLKLASSSAVDIVFVDASDVTVSEVMSRIASVTSSEWRKTGNEYRLTRTAATEKKEAEAELAERIARYEASLKVLSERSAPKRPIQPTGAVGGLQRIMPALIQRIGLRELAMLEDGRRYVYSSSPNRMQRPLGMTHDQVFARVIENFNYYRNGRQIEQTMASLTKLLDQFVGSVDEPNQSRREPEVLLSVTRSPNGGLTIDCRTYNSAGRATMATRVYLYENPLHYTPGAKAVLPKLQEPDEPLVLTGPSKEVSDWFTGKGPVPSPGVLTLYSKPDVNELFGFEFSSILEQVAKCKKVNIVANLPDDLMPISGAWGDSLPKTINEWLAQMMVNRSLTFSQADGWMSIVPTARASARNGRMKRAALAKLLQSCEGTGNARLADIVELLSDDGDSGAGFIDQSAPGSSWRAAGILSGGICEGFPFCTDYTWYTTVNFMELRMPSYVICTTASC